MPVKKRQTKKLVKVTMNIDKREQKLLIEIVCNKTHRRPILSAIYPQK